MLAGCSCADAFFTKGTRFEVDVVQPHAAQTGCSPDAGVPALSPGDSLTLLGTGDESFEAGMCGDGTLSPDMTPTFATQLLTSCNQFGCWGQNAAGCSISANLRTTRDQATKPNSDMASGTLTIQWNNSCEPTLGCQDTYDVVFRRLAR